MDLVLEGDDLRLRKLKIKNFRKIEDISISLPRGLCVIVGENNTGKTAIIDALRLLLMPGREFDAVRIDEDDFRIGSNFAPIEMSCTFCDATEEDEVHCRECLVDVGDGKFEIQLNARVEFNKTTRRANVKMWGGETEGGSLPSTLYDQITAVYLQPLRDPESGLRPGRYSQISRLVDCLTKEDQKEQFETIVNKANKDVTSLTSVKEARKELNSQMTNLAGSELAQSAELVFSDPSFYRIIAGLQPLIESLPFTLNGLGYNNLFFTAATLGTLQKNPNFAFRSILIEEPEAHLHPQLQLLLLSHLAQEAKSQKAPVQVIVSSHSPILASQAPLDSIVAIHQTAGRVTATSICDTILATDSKAATKLRKKLQRFLDATRAELFFARKILMVEGIAEALVVPVLAKIAGGSLKTSAVTVLNVDGLNFNAFIPLFGSDKLHIPIAILTDSDPSRGTGDSSATAQTLKAYESKIPNLKVELSAVTFEHQLARSPKLLPLMLDAYEAIHPNLGKKLREKLDGLAVDDLRAQAFYKEFKDSETSKGSFAQELAILLDAATLGPLDVPEYIRKALVHLGVIKEGDSSEPRVASGTAFGTEPSPN